jgi:antitoxin component YwqK of YwqJK toxin-antitoxin module
MTMDFKKAWASLLLIGTMSCLGVFQEAQAQIIGKEKKKLFFWQKDKEVTLNPEDTSLVVVDSLLQPSLTVAAKDSVEEKEKKKSKKKKAYFGYRVKKGFAKQGKGKNLIVETFYYLREYKEPNAYVQDKHYYDVKKRRIFKTKTLDPKKTPMLILHGPYTKKRGDVLIEQGYFYMGAKHLRWETFKPDSTLTQRIHYEKGFLRDAEITYYDAAKTKIKEIIPYQYGEVQGEYLKFYENGQVEWQGMYDKGRKVGTWINFYDFRGRRQFEYQYAESGFDQPKEPVLVKQYDRHGALVFEKKDR